MVTRQIDPYAAGVPGVYLCVRNFPRRRIHVTGGYNGARPALRARAKTSPLGTTFLTNRTASLHDKDQTRTSSRSFATALDEASSQLANTQRPYISPIVTPLWSGSEACIESLIKTLNSRMEPRHSIHLLSHLRTNLCATRIKGNEQVETLLWMLIRSSPPSSQW